VEVAYQGPLPPPRFFNQFNRVVPGLAREIADSAWKEQRHRHKWENNARFNDTFMQSGGLFLGWLLAASCVVGYFSLVYLHYPSLAALPLLGPPVLVTIRSMLPSRNQAKSSEEDKQKD